MEHSDDALARSRAARDVTVSGIAPCRRVQRRGPLHTEFVTADRGEVGAKVELVEPRRIVTENCPLYRAGRCTQWREAALVHHIGRNLQPAPPLHLPLRGP